MKYSSEEVYELMEFVSKVSVGTRIEGYGGQVVVVEEIKKRSFVGYDEKWFKKSGKKSKSILFFSTIMNPHYKRNLKILED